MRLTSFRFPSQCVNCSDWPSTRLCLNCRAPFASILQCNRCALSHASHEPCPETFAASELPWVSAYASLSYSTVAAKLIQRLKFNQELNLIHALADWMSDLPPPWLKSIANHTIVPMPSTRQSLQSRGFNQSAELARCVKKRLGLKGRIRHLLIRSELSQQQSLLNKQDRWLNMVHAFSTNRTNDSTSASGYLLIDDVMTTGATVMNAAQSLKQSGHWPIFVWVLARTPVHTLVDSIDEHRSGSP